MSTLADLRRKLAPWQLWLLDVGVPLGCALVALMFRSALESGWLLAVALLIAGWLIARPRWSPARLMRRRTRDRAAPADPVGPVPRWLINAAIALALVLATVQLGRDVPDEWWMFGALLVAGLLVQDRWPLLAVVLAGTGAFADLLVGHLDLLPLDLAAPITVYTLASRAKRRRSAVFAAAALFVAVFAISLANEMTGPAGPMNNDVAGKAYQCRPVVDCFPAEPGDPLPPEKRAAVEDSRGRGAKAVPGVPAVPAPPADKALPWPDGKPVLPPDAPRPGVPAGSWADPDATPLDQLRAIEPTDVGALGAWLGDRMLGALGTALFPILALGIALAFGDGVRSRRAHLRTLEQRAADLEREQHQRAALAAAAERARITRELHDVVAHGMSVMVVQAQGGAAALRRHPDRTAVALENVITTGRSSLAEMRRLLGVVGGGDATGQPQLAPQPGLCALPALVDQVRAAGTSVHLYVDGPPATLPSSVDLSAYRIVQEALTNTIKHAGPDAHAVVRIASALDWVEVEITDDGVGGASGVEKAGGNGLRGISERVGMLGGELAIGPGSDGSGFRVWALLPIHAGDGPT